MKNLFDLSGLVAIVAGGNGLVGSQCCTALADHGATVISLSRTNDSACTHSNIYNRICDVSDESEFSSMLESVVSRHGSPSIFVNAAVIRPMKRYLADSIENWTYSVSRNGLIAFVPMRLMANFMSKNIGGSLISIASIYGVRAPNMSVYEDCSFETEPDYAYNKSALVGITRYFASKFATHGVRANSIVLGGVENSQPFSFKKNYASRCPMKRLASPEEIATSIVFLASPFSSYVTGSVVSVDGGWTHS